MPRGVGAIRFLFLVGGLAVFAGLYIYFIVKIWQASAGKPPNFDNQLVYVASALGGVLGTFFAVALGVQRQDPQVDHSKLQLGTTLLQKIGAVGAALATSALWVYAAVGAAAGITVIFTMGLSA
jgi:hypothetical protein